MWKPCHHQLISCQTCAKVQIEDFERYLWTSYNIWKRLHIGGNSARVVFKLLCKKKNRNGWTLAHFSSLPCRGEHSLSLWLDGAIGVEGTYLPITVQLPVLVSNIVPVHYFENDDMFKQIPTSGTILGWNMTFLVQSKD